jgi:hypothetical protein
VSRTEFVRRYANRSNLPDEWAELGLIEFAGHKLIALPCGCGEEGCEGWAMVSAEGVLHHLFFCAPDAMRDPYIEIVGTP